jgi:hypothetical protein
MKKLIVFILILSGCTQYDSEDIGCVTGIPQNGTERVMIGCTTRGRYTSFATGWIEYRELQFDDTCSNCK